ncbi:CPBP family intramembrane metalloprotease [bacterium]|nr:CPBP family intramembrane metalloprotease [bacterium]
MSRKSFPKDLFVIILSALAASLWIYFSLKYIRNVWITFFGYHIFLCLLVPLFHIFPRGFGFSFSRIIALRNFKRALLPGLVTGAAMFAVIFIFFRIFGSSVLDMEGILELTSKLGVTDSNLFVFLLFMTIANATVEEFFWRGYVLGGLRHFIGARRALLFSSVLFTLHHIATTSILFASASAVLFSASIFLSGIFFGHMRLHYRSIYAPVISHFLADIGIMVVYLIYM